MIQEQYAVPVDPESFEPKFFTGVGSRDAPKAVLDITKLISWMLSVNHWTLRSGGAGGMDTAFEKGVVTKKEIYLPNEGFNGSTSALYPPSEEAVFLVTNKYWKSWSSEEYINLYARNMHQVLGQDLKTPSKFLLCWTLDGCNHGSSRTMKTGGTGYAIDAASDHNIPIFNLKRKSCLLALSRFVEIDILAWLSKREKNDHIYSDYLTS